MNIGKEKSDHAQRRYTINSMVLGIMTVAVSIYGLFSHAAMAQCSAYFSEYAQGFEVHFDSRVSWGGGELASLEWDFGDGNTSNEYWDTTHKYDVAGEYEVCLAIETTTGCTDTYCKTIMVGGDWCRASFYDLGSDSTEMQFRSEIQWGDGLLESVFWNFGDGSTSEEAEPTYTYDAPGMYDVCLTIETSTGCSDTYCRGVPVPSSNWCEIWYYPTMEADSLAVQFHSDIDFGVGTLAAIHWDFGDGNTGEGATLGHVYDSPGLYNVCATIDTSMGCMRTYCRKVAVGRTSAILISSLEELQKIGVEDGYPLTGHYRLTQHIDATITATWNDGAGFEPIGSEETPFTGEFDGQGYVVSGLVINRPDQDYIALFGCVTGVIRNLGVEDATITGDTGVGGLTGVNGGLVTQCHITGSVTGLGGVGGLVGMNARRVDNCYATGAVTGVSMVGGLVGWSESAKEISNCYTTNAVTGVSYVGGLLGAIDNTTVTDCHATGTITGNVYVGGLIGFNSSTTVSYCYATGAVTGEEFEGESDDDPGVGGLIGINYGGTVSYSYASGSVTGQLIGGGLIGINVGAVSCCYAIGSVKVSGAESVVGGLIGWNVEGTVSYCYATGSVIGIFSVGGLVGHGADGIVISSFWDWLTTGQSISAGGFGRVTSEMTYPYAENTYVLWDFDIIWAADMDYSISNGYPYLRDNMPDSAVEGEAPTEGEGEGEGEGEPAEGEAPVADRPLGFTALGGPDYILLRWAPNLDDRLTAYRLYRRVGDSGAFTLLASPDNSATRHTDGDVVVGQRYYYQLAVLVGGVESERTPAVSAVVGEISLSLDHIELPADEVGAVGVNVANVTGVTVQDMAITIGFDPTVLDSNDVSVKRTIITRGMPIDVTIDPAGSVRIVASNPVPVTLVGEGRLFQLEVRTLADASDGACGALAFIEAAFTSAPGAVIPVDASAAGSVCVSRECGTPGDVDSDGDVTLDDAHLVLDIAVRKVEAEACHWKTGELTGDGRIDSADAVMIMRMVRDRNTQPEDDDVTLADLWASGSPVVELAVPYEITALPGGTIDVPVRLKNGAGLAGIDMSVTFPPSSAGLTLDAFDAGTVVGDFAQRDYQGERFLRAGFASDRPVTAAKAEGDTLLTLRFQVAATASAGTSFPINLQGAKLSGAFGESFDWYTDVILLGGTITVAAPDAEGEGEGEDEDDDSDSDGGRSCLRGCGNDKSMSDFLGDWLLIGLSLMVILVLAGVTHRR